MFRVHRTNKGNEVTPNPHHMNNNDLLESQEYYSVLLHYKITGDSKPIDDFIRIRFTPNMDNYRAELLTVATAAMNGMLANSISKDEGVEPYWYMQSDRVAQYALEYAKSLLSAIDKSVKSNPASE